MSFEDWIEVGLPLVGIGLGSYLVLRLLFKLLASHRKWIESNNPRGAFDDATTKRWKKRFHPIAKAAVATSAFVGRFEQVGAICLVLVPIWTSALDLVGANLFANQHGSDLLPLVKAASYEHYAASLFLLTCGVANLIVLARGRHIPLVFAGITLLASIARLNISSMLDHDLSHVLFDSCTGYGETVAWGDRLALVSAISIALAALRYRFPSRFDAATP